ncbi:MAG: ATP-binding protein [Muribaculaceae bacterium]|nr:ATP-binding protein [Muribaculaceae bacterium]
MTKTINYPVGIQTFSEIIRNDYLYVDKTALVYKLVKDAKYIFLSRPRRFGKSLLMSTLEAYYKGSKDLFEHLKIWNLEKEWLKYPVFRFDLSGVNFNDISKFISRINRCLKEIAEDYSLVLDGDNIADSFRSLIRQAYRKFDRGVVILVDEYDKPMLDTIHLDELHDHVKEELRGFYSVIKLSDEYVKKAVIIGVTRFSRVSIFSGFNNLKDISMLPIYNGICGITASEFKKDFEKSVYEFAQTNSMTEDKVWEIFKKEYDGYHFAFPGEFIYNPFSVLTAFDNEIPGQYWFDSGSPSFLIKLVKNRNYLLGNLEGARRDARKLNDIETIKHDLIPLLYQAGYLTLLSYDTNAKEYILGFPNREVYEGFWGSLAGYFFRNPYGESSFDINKFLDNIYRGQPDKFMIRLRALFADTESDHEPNKEIHFQTMMAIACKMMGLHVATEIHSAMGRCDMTIETTRFIYIFEFKVNSTPEIAMAQIINKGYATRFAADTRTIFLIGANFSTHTRTLTQPWLIQTLSRQ